MVSQTLKGNSKQYFFEGAARFFLRPDGQVDPKKIDQLYGEVWTYQDIRHFLEELVSDLRDEIERNTGITINEKALRHYGVDQLYPILMAYFHPADEELSGGPSIPPNLEELVALMAEATSTETAFQQQRLKQRLEAELRYLEIVALNRRLAKKLTQQTGITELEAKHAIQVLIETRPDLLVAADKALTFPASPEKEAILIAIDHDFSQAVTQALTETRLAAQETVRHLPQPEPDWWTRPEPERIKAVEDRLIHDGLAPAAAHQMAATVVAETKPPTDPGLFLKSPAATLLLGVLFEQAQKGLVEKQAKPPPPPTPEQTELIINRLEKASLDHPLVNHDVAQIIAETALGNQATRQQVTKTTQALVQALDQPVNQVWLEAKQAVERLPAKEKEVVQAGLEQVHRQLWQQAIEELSLPITPPKSPLATPTNTILTAAISHKAAEIIKKRSVEQAVFDLGEAVVQATQQTLAANKKELQEVLTGPLAQAPQTIWENPVEAIREWAQTRTTTPATSWLAETLPRALTAPAAAHLGQPSATLVLTAGVLAETARQLGPPVEQKLPEAIAEATRLAPTSEKPPKTEQLARILVGPSAPPGLVQTATRVIEETWQTPVNQAIKSAEALGQTTPVPPNFQEQVNIAKTAVWRQATQRVVGNTDTVMAAFQPVKQTLWQGRATLATLKEALASIPAVDPVNQPAVAHNLIETVSRTPSLSLLSQLEETPAKIVLANALEKARERIDKKFLRTDPPTTDSLMEQIRRQPDQTGAIVAQALIVPTAPASAAQQVQQVLKAPVTTVFKQPPAEVRDQILGRLVEQSLPPPPFTLSPATSQQIRRAVDQLALPAAKLSASQLQEELAPAIQSAVTEALVPTLISTAAPPPVNLWQLPTAKRLAATKEVLTQAGHEVTSRTAQVVNQEWLKEINQQIGLTPVADPLNQAFLNSGWQQTCQAFGETRLAPGQLPPEVHQQISELIGQGKTLPEATVTAFSLALAGKEAKTDQLASVGWQIKQVLEQVTPAAIKQEISRLPQPEQNPARASLQQIESSAWQSAVNQAVAGQVAGPRPPPANVPLSVMATTLAPEPLRTALVNSLWQQANQTWSGTADASLSPPAPVAKKTEEVVKQLSQGQISPATATTRLTETLATEIVGPRATSQELQAVKQAIRPALTTIDLASLRQKIDSLPVEKRSTIQASLAQINRQARLLTAEPPLPAALNLNILKTPAPEIFAAIDPQVRLEKITETLRQAGIPEATVANLAIKVREKLDQGSASIIFHTAPPQLARIVLDHLWQAAVEASETESSGAALEPRPRTIPPSLVEQIQNNLIQEEIRGRLPPTGTLEVIARAFAQEITGSKASPGEVASVAETITPVLKKIDSALLNQAITDLPAAEQGEVRQQLSRVQEQSWQRAVDSLVEPDGPPAKELTGLPKEKLAELLADLVSQQPPATSQLVAVLTPPPLTGPDTTVVLQTVSPYLLREIPQITLSAEKLEQLPESVRAQRLEEIRQLIRAGAERALIYAIPTLGQQVVLPPEQIPVLLTRLTPSDTEITDWLPILNLPPEERIRLAQLTVEQQTLLATYNPLQPIQEPASQTWAAAADDQPLDYLRDENGQLLRTSLINQLVNQGINPQTAHNFTQTLRQIQAARLTWLGLSPDDLQNTIDERVKAGANPETDPAIRELKRLKQQMVTLENQSPPDVRRLIARQRRLRTQARRRGAPAYDPRLTGNIFIHEKAVYLPRLLLNRVDRWFRRLFGERILTLTSNYQVLVSRFNLLRQKIIGNLAARFYRTGLGQTVQLLSRRAAQAGLGKLFGVGLRQAASKAVQAAVVKVGLKLGLAALGTAVAPVIGTAVGWLVGFVAEKVVGGVLRLGKRLIGAPGRFFSGLFKPQTGDVEIFPEKTLRWLYISFFVFIIFTAHDKSFLTGSAFQQPGLGGGAIIQGTVISPDCQPSRHLAEETICLLSKNQSPCDQHFVTLSNWPVVDSCFQKINFSLTSPEGKEAIKKQFKDSVDLVDPDTHNLQCVGFVRGIKKAENRPLDPRNARDYLGWPVDGYAPKSNQGEGPPPANPGDLAIWRGTEYGHIAIILEQKGNTIIVAEANGQTGKIAVVAYPYRRLGAGDGSPDGILTPF